MSCYVGKLLIMLSVLMVIFEQLLVFKMIICCFSATVKLHYDLGIKQRFGSDAENMARRVMAHAQNVFMWKSLTTKVIFKVHSEVRLIKEECHPSSSL